MADTPANGARNASVSALEERCGVQPASGLGSGTLTVVTLAALFSRWGGRSMWLALSHAQFIRHSRVLIVHDRVKIVACDTCGIFAFFNVLRSGDGLAVVFEVLAEVNRQFVGDKFGGDAGLFQLGNAGVGGGEERRLAWAVGEAEFGGDAGFILFNRAGSAPMFWRSNRKPGCVYL